MTSLLPSTVPHHQPPFSKVKSERMRGGGRREAEREREGKKTSKSEREGWGGQGVEGKKLTAEGKDATGFEIGVSWANL